MTLVQKWPYPVALALAKVYAKALRVDKVVAQVVMAAKETKYSLYVFSATPTTILILSFFLIRFRAQVFPKAPKLSPGPATLARQDTIDEGGEADQLSPPTQQTPPQREPRHQLERQPTERDRLIDSAALQRERDRIERNLSLERERQIEMASSRATTSDTYDTGLREQPITMVQRDLIATVLDMKVDVHLEMQRMSQRIGRLEDLLTELIRRISQDSSGQSTPADETSAVTSATTTQPNVTIPPGSVISTVASAHPSTSAGAVATTAGSSGGAAGASLGGTTLGPILLRKRRSKSRKAPAPPKTSPEQTRLLEAELPSSTVPRKRDFL